VGRGCGGFQGNVHFHLYEKTGENFLPDGIYYSASFPLAKSNVCIPFDRECSPFAGKKPVRIFAKWNISTDKPDKLRTSSRSMVLPGGVLRVSSYGDGRMGAKIKTQKNP